MLVEKPPAMLPPRWRGSSASPATTTVCSCPGTCCSTTGRAEAEGLVDSGVLGDVLCVYGNQQNLGVIRSNENALWSLGVHDLSVILWLLGEEPDEAVAHGPISSAQRRGRRGLLPPLRVREGRAHASVLARPAQDAEDDRGRTREDGCVRRHGARAEDHRLREGAVGARRDLRRVADPNRGHLQPQDRERRAAAPRGRALPLARRERTGRPPRGTGRARRRPRPRSAHGVAPCGSPRTAVVHEGPFSATA